MKKLALIVQDLNTLFQRERASLLVILLSLGLSVGVSLSMICYFSSTADIFREMKSDKATYRLHFSAASEEYTPIEVFDLMFFNKNSLAVREAYYAVSFSIYPSSAFSVAIAHVPDSSQTDSGPLPTAATQNISWRAAFPDDHLAPLAERPEEKALLEGRWFEPKELNNGAAVAVVGRNDFPDAKVGDIILILESEVKVIGIRREHNTLPYVLMQQLSGKTRGFIPDDFHCTFSSPLSEKQSDELTRFGVTTVCMFDLAKSGYYMEIASMLAISSGIFLLAVLNALALFKHLVSASRYRFMVLKICGAGRSTVFWGLYQAPLLICALSSIAGILFYRLLLEPWIMDQFQYEALPFWLLSAVFAIILLLCFLFLLPTVRRVTKAQPAETALWR